MLPKTGFELLGLSDSPASASRVPGIIAMHYCTQLQVAFFSQPLLKSIQIVAYINFVFCF
jgi:hypothetical protein